MKKSLVRDILWIVVILVISYLASNIISEIWLRKIETELAIQHSQATTAQYIAEASLYQAQSQLEISKGQRSIMQASARNINTTSRLLMWKIAKDDILFFLAVILLIIFTLKNRRL